MERKNRTILNLVRSMLQTKNIPKKFWTEAVDCAIYLLNRWKTSSLENITPQKAWSGDKLTVSHLKVFGSVAYAHISDQMHVKLDDKSLKLIFVGYDERSKAYKFFDPISKKMHISRDVQVNEEAMWDWDAMVKVFHEKARDAMHISVNMLKSTSNNNEEAPTSTTHEPTTSNNEQRIQKTRSIRDL